ncbi:hypothetical protein MCELHM10_03903 [Paracoccaceae bacterium]
MTRERVLWGTMLALASLLVVLLGGELHMAGKKYVGASQYDAEAARKLLRAHGKLLESEGGILASRLGVSKDDFLVFWDDFSTDDLDVVYKKKIEEIALHGADHDREIGVSRSIRLQIFLMRAISEALVATDPGSAQIEITGIESGRVDSVLVETSSRRINVSKFVLDIFEDDQSLINGDTIENMTHFIRNLGRKY